MNGSSLVISQLLLFSAAPSKEDSGGNIAGVHRLGIANTYSGSGFAGVLSYNYGLNLLTTVNATGRYCGSGISFTNSGNSNIIPKQLFK